MAVRQPGEGIHVWQRSIVDDEGNVLPGASISVVDVSDPENEVTAKLYTTIDGDRSLSNPFNADEEGFARFYAASGVYRITVTSGSFSRTWYDVELGIMLDALPDLTTIIQPIVQEVVQELLPEETNVRMVWGNVKEDGTLSFNYTGFNNTVPVLTSEKLATGRYRISHDLAVHPNNYSVAYGAVSAFPFSIKPQTESKTASVIIVGTYNLEQGVAGGGGRRDGEFDFVIVLPPEV